MALLPLLFRDDFFGRIALRKPVVDSFLGDADFSGPLSGCLSPAVIGNEDCITGDSGINRLLASCGPAAVVGAVVSVIINSVKGVSFGSFPHVLNKHPEIKPSWPDGDAATPVVDVIVHLRILTPLVHKVPSVIEGVVTFAYTAVSHVGLLTGRLISGSGALTPVPRV